MFGATLLGLLRQSNDHLPQAEFGGQPIELFEYAALKQEQSTRLALRETALYVNLAVLLSLLAARVQAVITLDDNVMLLLPYLAGVMFWIYFNNDYYVNRIGTYITDYLAPRLYAQIEARAETGSHAGKHGVPKADMISALNKTDRRFIFSWEYLHRDKSVGRRVRKAVNLLVLLLSYTAAPVLILVTVGQHPMPTLQFFEWVGGIIVTCTIALGTFTLSA